jgi:hypothetical protein
VYIKLEEGERDVKDVGAGGVCSLGASGLLATLTTRHESRRPNSAKNCHNHMSHCVTFPDFPSPKLCLLHFYCMEAMVVITMMTPRFAYRCTVYTLPHSRKRAQRWIQKKNA